MHHGLDLQWSKVGPQLQWVLQGWVLLGTSQVHLSKVPFQVKYKATGIHHPIKQEHNQGHPHRIQAWDILEVPMVANNKGPLSTNQKDGMGLPSKYQ